MPCAMENSVDVENIEFKNKNGTAFTLTPFHKLGKEKTSEGLFELFQNEQVYKYYESGTK